MNTFALDTWESICDLGRAKSENLDTARWDLGDLGNVVMEHYSDKSLDDFAREIGQRKSTCYQYAAVARFYDLDLRTRLKDELPNVNYSMMRDAMRTGDGDMAIEWLYDISANGYTADEASRELTLKLGRETRDSISGRITDRFLTTKGNFITVQIDDADSWIPGMSVTIRKGK